MKKISTGKMWIFAIGQLGWSLLSGIISSWLVYFYEPTEEIIAQGHSVLIPQGLVIFGVVTIIGLITSGGRIFDAITDPWIASCSDRCRNKLGRRIPFLRGSAIPFALTTTLIFCCPLGSESVLNGIWVAVMVMLFYLFMTMYCTPYNALIPELGNDQKSRINISTFISFTFIVGTAIAYCASSIWAILQSAFGLERLVAIRITFAALSLIALICMLVPAFAINEKDYIDSKPVDSKVWASLAKTFKNKQFRIFVFSDILYFFALTMFQTGLPFYVTKLMNLGEDKNGLLFVVMTAASLIFYVPVNVLAKKIGKKKLVVFAFVWYSAVFALTTAAGLLGMGSMANGMLIALLASVSMAVLGILPQAIVADIAEADAAQTGENREGMFFAARTFAFKFGQSCAMLLFTSISAIERASGLGYRLTAAVAAVVCLVGAIILSFYKEKQIMATIEAKNAEITETEVKEG